MSSRSVALVVVTAAVVAAVAAPASAARVIKANPARFWGVTYLGDWHVAVHPEYPKAVRALSAPTSVANPDIPGCAATWAGLGLRIQFESFGGGTSCADGRAQAAVVKGPNGRSSWRTQRGLRVGDSLRKLRRLYPNARRKGSARVIVYQENPMLGDGSIVTAVIRHHKVASFRLWLGGAGD
jgi:hypothetical protein